MLKKGDHVICAYAEPAAGPGWSNAPIWVIVQDQTGVLRMACIHYEEQTPEMMYLYKVAAATHEAITSAVKNKFEKL